MRTPTDATSHAGATVSLINSGTDFQMASLYTFTLASGAVVRWSGADVALSFNGNTWTLGPTIKRGAISHKRGVEVATLEITLGATSSDTINGAALLPFIRGNGLDGATVRLDRAFLPDWASPITGTVIDFSGRVTSIKNLTRSEVTIVVSSWLVLLNVNMGPDFYQPSCLNQLFDTNCTKVKSSYAVTGTVSGSPTVLAMNTSLTQADGYFTLGEIDFTSGANVGQKRSIKSYVNASGAIGLSYPLPVAPTAGDAFTIYPGCDLKQATCSGKFSNLVHFRGQPYIPQPEIGV